MDSDVPLTVRKLTGPIEHWLTTFHTGYWGFRPDKKDAWQDIQEDEVFLFHASKTEFLDAPRGTLSDLDTGIIGLGRVGAFSGKDEPAWWGEIHGDGNYPFLIHFSELYWFGDIDDIRDAPVAEKAVSEMVDDVHRLAENIISFGEMRDRTGYQIPAQGSPGNVKQPDKLLPLLRERLDGSTIVDPESEEMESEPVSAGAEIRKRTRERSLDPDSVETRTISYESSIKETITGNFEHEQTLDQFEDYLTTRGFAGGETSQSDLIMRSSETVVLGEAKYVHERNEATQIRKGLGQLLEYRYIDIYSDEELSQLSLVLCLVLSNSPSESYRDVLESVEDDGIYTYWIEDGAISGPEDSMRRLQEITG